MSRTAISSIGKRRIFFLHGSDSAVEFALAVMKTKEILEMLVVSKTVKIEQIFDMLAVTTWRSIERAYDRRISMGEDAITTYNLLAIDSSGTNSVVVEDTRVEESRKGCDWEFWIGSDRFGWRRYAIQAKRLSVSDGRYHSLAHKVSGMSQIEILDLYSLNNRASPLYCFYNYDRGGTKVKRNCCNSTSATKQFGCSITPSSVVKKAIATRGGKSFASIHAEQQTLPWSCLVKCPRLLGAKSSQCGIIATDAPDNYHKELPGSIQLIRKTRNAEILVDAPDEYSDRLGLRPRWVGIIDIDN